MPTITYRKSELKKLIGKKLSDDQLGEIITLIKPNLDGIDGDSITIEHTADRSDLFGIEGLARSIANYVGLRKGLTKYNVLKPKIDVSVKVVPVRPYTSAFVVRGARMDGGFFESVINIQELLNDSIGRRRAKAATGIHDLDKIKGPISYVGVPRSEKMVPLESAESMTLEKVLEKVGKGVMFGGIIRPAKIWPAFKDSHGIFSFPPIINSDRTKVTEKTRNLFVEVTGTEKQAVSQVANILATNFGERFSLEGVKLRHEKKSETTPNLSESVSEISVGMVERALGVKLSAKEVIDLLKRMGYDALGSADKIEVIVPAFRNDILHPIDIIEDVAIAYGYNNFKPELPNISTTGRPLDLETLSRRASMALVGFGFQEMMNSVLSNPTDQFEKMSAPRTDLIEIANPSSSDFTCMRVSLLPSLLKVLSSNKHYEYPQNVFEVGDAVLPDKVEETLARNERRVAGVVCHSRAGFAELKHVVDGLMKSLEMGYSTRGCDSEVFIPGRGVDMYIGRKFVGSFGELHPKVIQSWDIGMPVASFEINLQLP